MGAHRFLAVGAVPLTLALLSGCHLVFGLDKLTYEDTGGGGAGGGGGTGGTGGTTTIDPGCIPSQTPNAVRDDCGVFVSSSTGDDSPANDGSQDKPFATIAKALGSAKSGPIYLCAETFTEAVQIKAGATIYGGLDCASGEWTWIGPTKKSEISPEAGLVALVLDPGVAATVEDVTLRAKDAVEAGGSSIAVIATSGAELDLARCDVETGNGKDGATGGAFAMSAAPGAMGNGGVDACTAVEVNGGSSVQNACDEADPNDNSIGGSGGDGEEVIGGAGSPGTPLGTMNGGTGQLDDAGMCTTGTPGDDGTSGTSGTGAQGTGTITAQGYAGPAANPGDKGKPGQGGGGGGGAKGGTAAGKCADMASAGGASGGSGGSGGCGGAGGKGGQAGGASIGIVSLGATLVFADVKITTKNGGKGGDGGAGQLGGMGGPAGAGGSKASAASLKDGCSGGPGGKGGGGAGGPSIGIAHTGEAPDIKSATTTLGSPGSGGAGEGDAGNGAPGIAEVTRSFL